MTYLPFLCARNLIDNSLSEGQPWNFAPAAADLERIRATTKTYRRNWILDPDSDWNVYSSVRGLVSNARVSGTNPAAGLRGLAADYDMKSRLDVVEGYLNQIPVNFRPNFIETSLGGKVRLVWVFERELLINGSAAGQRIIEALFTKIGIPRLLPGYDPASTKPTQLWTNGGEWRDFTQVPLPWNVVFGVAVDVSKKEESYSSEIAMETIAEEVHKRWPGRWEGPFEKDALGLRFWDDGADCDTGCQVKPDGMLCFTGTKAFVSWAEIFGPRWTSEQRALHLSKAAGEIYFDGRRYWDCQGGRWFDLCREDVTLLLRNAGLSSKAARGQNVSDVDKVLAYIQVSNRVEGAAPIIGRKPGLIELDRRRVINTYTIRAMEPAGKKRVSPEEDFSWVWHFLNGLFDNPQDRPVDYFLSWLQRFYRAQREDRRMLGQAIFLCGPAGNGKTLLSRKIIKPLIGDQVSNPYDYFTGATQFNEDIFNAPLLAIDDEEAPEDDRERKKFLARIKSFVVNPSLTYSPKFMKRVNVEWAGRIFVTLNDDASSVGLLPEVNDNTHDKLSFYGSRPYARQWPAGDTLEETITRELPFFGRWLLDIYKPPAEILGEARMGVFSYYDRRIARIGRQQHPSYNLLELIRKWIAQGPYWQDNAVEWIGNPTDLHSAMLGCATTESAARKWEAPRAYWALTTLDRLKEPGIVRVAEEDRVFKLIKSDILKNQPQQL